MLTQDAIGTAGRAMESAVTFKLENKNASTGFWTGLVAGGAAFFNNPPGFSGWAIPEDVAKGVVGGLGSMNKHGKGFMSGFWSQESDVIASNLNDRIVQKWLKNHSNNWQDVALAASGGLMGGVKSRLGAKTFATGLFTGAASAFLKDIFEPNPLRQKPQPGAAANVFSLIPAAVTQGFTLLQPKVVKNHSTLPLDTIKGGYWALGMPYGVLY